MLKQYEGVSANQPIPRLDKLVGLATRKRLRRDCRHQPCTPEVPVFAVMPAPAGRGSRLSMGRSGRRDVLVACGGTVYLRAVPRPASRQVLMAADADLGIISLASVRRRA